MDMQLEPGTYVVAVSGGVDSIALLDMLRQKPGLKLIVAHLDHGIREDSKLDKQLVQQLAAKYGLPFVHDQAHLGPDTSEAAARHVRYEFLHKVREATGAKAIITAHHQDDSIETAVINLLRGTGRRGLSSLKSTDTVIRPLLHVTKPELKLHAQLQNLPWREDSTNTNTKFLRNHIRHNIIPKLSREQRDQLIAIIQKMHTLNDEIDAQIVNHLHIHLENDQLERKWFIQMPHSVALEIMHSWLRRHKIKNIDKKTLERLVVAAKTFPVGQHTDIDGKHALWMQKDQLVLKHR